MAEYDPKMDGFVSLAAEIYWSEVKWESATTPGKITTCYDPDHETWAIVFDCRHEGRFYTATRYLDDDAFGNPEVMVIAVVRAMLEAAEEVEAAMAPGWPPGKPDPPCLQVNDNAD